MKSSMIQNIDAVIIKSLFTIGVDCQKANNIF